MVFVFSVLTLAKKRKKSSCEHHWVDLLCSLAILTCPIHILQYRGAQCSRAIFIYDLNAAT
jgi:hypothetical protein